MPHMNHRIDLNKTAEKIAGKKFCKCDLYWPDYKFAVEYDNDAYHTGSIRITQDSIRRTALHKMGIAEETVTNKELYHYTNFKEIAHIVAAHTGKRLQYKEPAFTDTCLALREQLFMDSDIWNRL